MSVRLVCHLRSFLIRRLVNKRQTWDCGLQARGMKNLWPEPITFPSLDQVFDELNYYRQPKNLEDIGVKQSASAIEAQARAEAADDAELSDLEDALEAVAPIKDLALDYEKLLSNWEKTIAGQNEIMRLANHYGIYRDLFSSSTYDPNPIPFTMNSEQAKQQARIRPEWWDAAIPEKSVKPENFIKMPPTYIFRPIAPLIVEFDALESDIDPESTDKEAMIISRSHRGNHIDPAYARNKPSVVIDAAQLSGKLATPSAGSPGNVPVTIINDDGGRNFYSVMLLNLDSHLNESLPIVHWFAANVKPGQSKCDEFVKYLPVYGVRGFGYSRFVTVAFQHEQPLKFDLIDDYDLKKRTYDPLKLVQEQNATPIGLSWFQTQWDESSNAIFHDFLQMKAPVYEYEQPKEEKKPEVDAIPLTPFNIFLDYYRDPKDINKQVLQERLKKVDVFGYQKEFEPSKVPPNIQWVDDNVPSWMWGTLYKQRLKIGPWRGLRLASATLAHNNNADLDASIHRGPPNSRAPLNLHFHYPNKKPMCRGKLKGSFWTKPSNENTSIRISQPDNLTPEEKQRIGYKGELA